mgnify:FL=1
MIMEMSEKIIVIDDNPEIREVVNVLLSSEGYTILEAKNAEEALEQIDASIDLIILDIMMPGMDGYQLCTKLREVTNAPILFLSAKGQDADKTLAFSSGGDDYLTKPFSYNELNSRVKALLRRYHIYQGKDHSTKQESVLSIGKLKLDTNLKTAFKDGKEILLTDIEYQILLFFAQHKNTVYSLAEIYENIWQEKYYYGANNTVMVHIRNLRKKIEDDPSYPTVIKTSWGKGYYSE